MPKTHNATGRSLTKGNFGLIPETVMHSPAYRATSLAGRALLLEVAVLYRGSNNGFIGLSARQAAERLRCSKDTAARAFRELQEHGLITMMRRGNFKAKTAPLASEWSLTWRPCNRSNHLPSHAYQRWQPGGATKPGKKIDGPISGTVARMKAFYGPTRRTERRVSACPTVRPQGHSQTLPWEGDTMTKPQLKQTDKLTIAFRDGEYPALVSAKALIGPHITNAFALVKFGAGSIGDVAIDHAVAAMCDGAQRVHKNDLRDVEAMLISQATTLNVMFGEMTRRAGLNMTDYPLAADRYFKMAMKAQNQCRMTLETLANVKNPPTIFTKQANIANGPQQVNNGIAPSAAPAMKSGNRPKELLEQGNVERLDTGTQGGTGSGNQPMEAMVRVDRTKDT